MPPFAIDREAASLVYLINLTAGLLDGDGHLLEIDARDGTRAVVTGQSATRIHPAGDRFATQQWNVSVANDACLVVLPGPVIPFAGCRYFQRARIELAARARLLWGDIWLPGRYDRGALSERFQFERIIQDLEVRREGTLVYRDRFCWNGPWAQAEIDWHLGGKLASASLFISGPLDDSLGAAPSEVTRSIFTLGTDLSCIRSCGAPGAVTADLVQCALGLAARWNSGPSAQPWLISSSDLAPNHWFSTPTLPE
jgi:urease accessory protein